MKKTITLLLITLTTMSCSSEVEVLNIPLTSSSKEAIALFTSDVFRVKPGY